MRANGYISVSFAQGDEACWDSRTNCSNSRPPEHPHPSGVVPSPRQAPALPPTPAWRIAVRTAATVGGGGGTTSKTTEPPRGNR